MTEADLCPSDEETENQGRKSMGAGHWPSRNGGVGSPESSVHFTVPGSHVGTFGTALPWDAIIISTYSPSHLCLPG